MWQDSYHPLASRQSPVRCVLGSNFGDPGPCHASRARPCRSPRRSIAVRKRIGTRIKPEWVETTGIGARVRRWSFGAFRPLSAETRQVVDDETDRWPRFVFALSRPGFGDDQFQAMIRILIARVDSNNVHFWKSPRISTAVSQFRQTLFAMTKVDRTCLQVVCVGRCTATNSFAAFVCKKIRCERPASTKRGA